jgi:hypothetical protein
VSDISGESITLKLIFSLIYFDIPLPMKSIKIVNPNNTKTNEMLIVDVIFAFKNLAVDTFFFTDIQLK